MQPDCINIISASMRWSLPRLSPSQRFVLFSISALDSTFISLCSSALGPIIRAGQHATLILCARDGLVAWGWTQRGLTVLHIAAYHGRVEVARELVAAGASWNNTDEKGITLVHAPRGDRDVLAFWPPALAEDKYFQDTHGLHSMTGWEEKLGPPNWPSLNAGKLICYPRGAVTLFILVRVLF